MRAGESRPSASRWKTAAGRSTLGQGLQALAEVVCEFDDPGQSCHVAGPLETNGISLDPDLKDAWGLPALCMTYRDHPDDLSTIRFLRDRALEIAATAKASKIWAAPVQEQTFAVHLLGTCRMGNDPQTSVVDSNHRAHDVRNLFICDGSSFVTSGRGQPTMTIMALAFRAGRQIASATRRGEV